MGAKVFDIRERSVEFGIRIIKLSLSLPKNTVGFEIGSQIVRSGTSIGANIEEAQNSGSKKEFIRSMTIALKEARETGYWLELVGKSGLIAKKRLTEIIEEDKEITRVLIAIVKKSKLNC